MARFKPRFKYRTKGSSTRTGTKTHTPYIPAKPKRGKTPAKPAQPATTNYTSNVTYTPAQSVSFGTPSFKIPAPVTFVTGASLVIINNWENGSLKVLLNLLWGGAPLANPKETLGPFLAEMSFVIVLSFVAEANGSMSGIVFAFFIGMWLVWSVNNADTLVAWTEPFRSKVNPPANEIIKNADKKG